MNMVRAEMNGDGLAAEQSASEKQMLFDLYGKCRRRYLRAAQLMEIPRAQLGAIDTLGASEPVTLLPLQHGWKVFCERYRKEAADYQLNLLDKEAGTERQWGKWVYNVFFPTILQDDEFVRNVLRAVGAIPCTDAKMAATALIATLTNMTLPAQTPTWATETQDD
jgi:hypothetical protein